MKGKLLILPNIIGIQKYYKTIFPYFITLVCFCFLKYVYKILNDKLFVTSGSLVLGGVGRGKTK